MGFNFANLLPGAKATAATEHDEDKAMDEDDAPEDGEDAAMDDDEDASDDDASYDGDDKDAMDEDEDDDKAAKKPSAKTLAAARRAGATAERARCVGILAAAAPHTAAQAATMIASGVPLKAAKAALAAAPKAAGRLADAMKGRDPQVPTAGGGAASSLSPDLQAAQARLIAKRSR